LICAFAHSGTNTNIGLTDCGFYLQGYDEVKWVSFLPE